MIYPKTIEEKLGFDIIRDRLTSYCVSELGKKLVGEIGYQTDSAQIAKQLTQVYEFEQLLSEGNVPGLGAITDISGPIEKSRVEGNWLAAKDLYNVFISIASALNMAEFINRFSSDYPSLREILPELGNLKGLEKRLALSVDVEGAVLNSASGELKRIRKEIISEQGGLRKAADTIFKKAKADGFVPEGASIGVREGRMVIPVIASNKRQIQGFIHDESATGSTVFLEPAAILDSNNKIRELQISESREIHKILIELTDQVRENQTELGNANVFLGEVDLLWSKAKLAKAIDASMPEIVAGDIELIELRHPLLALSSTNQKRSVVSHDVSLSEETRILMISGPNAGGKSVALKSIGLNQMMLQSGVAPCCNPDSKFCIFDDLFIDIGDEQSIDNDLSTYSSHLKNMSVMLTKATSKSMILIDEFGSGTDPAFGGAIAEAVLQKLMNNQCFGVITTHFSNLKIFAEKSPGIINGAMVFDLDKLKPLYELEIGRPGSSFSLEVAAQSGLPENVIKDAQEGVGVNQVDIEKLLGKLENEKRKLEEQNHELSKKDKELTSLKNEYQQLKQKLEVNQKEIISRAKEEASGILAQTNKEIEKTIRHIKENKAEKKETKKIRESLTKYASRVAPPKSERKTNEKIIIEGELHQGDQAITETGVVVEVVEVKGKKAKILMGELSSVMPLSKLKKISKRTAKQARSSKSYSTVAKSVSNKMAEFSSSLDIRGKRAIDVLPILQQFIDSAVMLGQSNIKVIHGKGSGALRQLVREELKQWSQVESIDNEHADRGGDGVTLITLK